MKIKNILVLVISILVTFGFAGCQSQEAEEIKDTNMEVIKIGASPVPHSEILEYIKPILEKDGIKLEIIEFTDYVTPNLALENGEIDANFFQHLPYLETFTRENNIKLSSIGNIHVEPLGLYSKKIKNIEDLAENAKIAIPNDPTNEGRALILLQNKGLITLKAGYGLESTIKDIKINPKNFDFKEVEAAQLPRTLDDVDASIINTNYAIEAGLDLNKDALISEGKESPYANILVVRPEDEKNESILKLLEVLQSEDVRTFINEKYKGAVVPAF